MHAARRLPVGLVPCVQDARDLSEGLSGSSNRPHRPPYRSANTMTAGSQGLGSRPRPAIRVTPTDTRGADTEVSNSVRPLRGTAEDRVAARGWHPSRPVTIIGSSLRTVGIFELQRSPTCFRRSKAASTFRDLRPLTTQVRSRPVSSTTAGLGPVGVGSDP